MLVFGRVQPHEQLNPDNNQTRPDEGVGHLIPIAKADPVFLGQGFKIPVQEKRKHSPNRNSDQGIHHKQRDQKHEVLLL